MRYLGGKSRTARRIVEAITEHASSRTPLDRWVEPFMGGGSVTVEVSRRGEFSSVHASDLDNLVVAYWNAIREGWVPVPHVSFEEYESVRANPGDYCDAHVAHVAYNCSFGGKRWGGYARSMKSDGITPRNHADESSRRDSRLSGFLVNTVITQGDYVSALRGAGHGDVVYCDPPYEGTTGYRSGPFEHDAFWSHVQDAANAGALVYVSEYAHPPHVQAEPVWTNVQSKSVRGGAAARPTATDNVFFTHPTQSDTR